MPEEKPSRRVMDLAKRADVAGEALGAVGADVTPAARAAALAAAIPLAAANRVPALVDALKRTTETAEAAAPHALGLGT